MGRSLRGDGVRVYEGRVIGMPIIAKDYINVDFRNMFQPPNQHYALHIHQLGHWCNATVTVSRRTATWVIHDAPENGHIMWARMPLDHTHIREHLFDGGDLYLHGTRYPYSGHRTDIRVAAGRCVVRVGDDADEVG